MRVVLLGPPGSGKGTVAKELCSLKPFVHLSTGDLFRKHIQNKTQLGQLAEQYISKGQLVPDEVTMQMVEEFIDSSQIEWILLDGAARTLNQAKMLDAILEKKDLEVDHVLVMNASPELIIERLSGRLTCLQCGRTYHLQNKKPKVEGICDVCGGPVIVRDDDKPEAIKTRLEAYEEQTAPLIDYYREAGKTIDINCAQSIEEVFDAVKTALEL